METSRIYGTIPSTLKLQFDEKVESGVPASQIIYEALDQYLNPSITPFSEYTKINHSIEEIKEMINNQPMYRAQVMSPNSLSHPLTEPVINNLPTQGPGAIGKLKAMGVDMNQVLSARRASRAGRPYDKELEKYFTYLDA